MSRAVVIALALSVLASPTGASQEQTAAPAVQPVTSKPKPGAPAEPPADAPPPAPRAPLAQLANLRIDLTITDQRGTAPAAPKTVSMLLADRHNGRIRTIGQVRVGTSYQPITLNVDAQPEILRDGRIRVQVSLEYRAQTQEGSQEDNQPSNLTESFNVILEDGKTVLVTQSADPATDRKVRVDLKASLAR
jgi:hypothetical protein